MSLEMRQVQHIHEEIRDVLNKADDKFDETTKKMESYVQTKVSEVSSEKNVLNFYLIRKPPT